MLSEQRKWWQFEGNVVSFAFMYCRHKSTVVKLRTVQVRIFDSKLADVGNPLVRQLSRYLRWPRVDHVAWRESQGRQGPAGHSRQSPAMAKSSKRIALGADQPRAFRLPWLRVFRDFSSVVWQMPGYTMESWGTALTPLPKARRLHLRAWQKSHTSVCDWASLDSEPRQQTNQSLSLPQLV